jgi:hypothetical protein
MGGLRLMSMVTMLVVLGLIIAKAADPATWGWLADDDRAAEARKVDEAAAKAAGKAPVKPVTAQKVAAQQERVTPGPTDEDIEEQDGAAEEFLALTDGGIELNREEMPAYWRLFGWAEHQTSAQMRKRAAEQLQKRASQEIVLNQFIRDPDDHRGQLFSLDLNVRRVLAYDAPPNKAGVKKVYEIWGWTTESKAWLYCVLTAQLPEGMPTGSDVHERVTFAGYFFKVQGYHAAGAGPNDRPLMAPLFIGRVNWKPSELRAAQAQSDWDWLARTFGNGPRWPWIFAGLVVVFVILRLSLWLYGRSRRAAPDPFDQWDSPTAAKGAGVRKWLAGAEESGPLDANVLEDEGGPANWNGPGDGRRNSPDFHNN